MEPTIFQQGKSPAPQEGKKDEQALHTEVFALSDNPVYSAEYVAGIAAGVAPELTEGLRNAFTSAAERAGILFSMSRAADREGYSEVAEAFLRYGTETVKQAGMLGEALGDHLSNATNENLVSAWKAGADACATLAKLAKIAKEQNLDALHDLLHESAREEAGISRGIAGLWKRNFEKE